MTMRRRALWRLWTTLLAVGLVTPAVIGQNNGRVEARLAVYKVTRDADGKEHFAPTTEAKPGDLLEYRLTYTNNTKQAIQGLQATLPLPEGLAYVAKSARPEKVDASLDGEKFAPAPLRRKVKDADGTERTVDVPTSEYRALRWGLGTLGAAMSTTVKARAKVVGEAG